MKGPLSLYLVLKEYLPRYSISPADIWSEIEIIKEIRSTLPAEH
jgi:hypothetical protein